jgi:hypothetical protein
VIGAELAGGVVAGGGGELESCAEAGVAAKHMNSPASNDVETRRGFFI